jgi:hypothetical protein
MVQDWGIRVASRLRSIPPPGRIRGEGPPKAAKRASPQGLRCSRLALLGSGDLFTPNCPPRSLTPLLRARQDSAVRQTDVGA